MGLASAKKTASEIKSLKIQGASNVRKATVNAIEKVVSASKAKTADALRNEIKKAAKILFVRPTEPETKNAIRIILRAARGKNIKEMKKNVLREISEYEKNREASKKKIPGNALKLFKKKSIVFTHCHSSTVEEILKLAHKKGKISRIISTETRPRFQGRITTKNLSNAGIKVTHIVDGAAATYMKEADIFITGADAILANGNVVNKVGTSLIALCAEKENVPYYVCASSHKFDQETYFGKVEKIEMRNADEVWNKKMKNLTIKNPAFDITEAKYIKAIVSEKGILKPKEFAKREKKNLN